MSDILIRSFPGDVLKIARSSAAAHRRSLQAEMRETLVQAIRFRAGDWSRSADRVRARLSRGRKPGSDSAALLREDRSR